MDPKDWTVLSGEPEQVPTAVTIKTIKEMLAEAGRSDLIDPSACRRTDNQPPRSTGVPRPQRPAVTPARATGLQPPPQIPARAALATAPDTETSPETPARRATSTPDLGQPEGTREQTTQRRGLVARLLGRG